MTLLSSLARRLRTARRQPIDDLDLTDPQFCQDPFPTYARLRAEASVHQRRSDGRWFVFGYDDVATAFMQPQIFSSQPLAAYDPHLLGADPPAHTTARRAAARELTAMVPIVAGLTESIAMRLLTLLAERAEFDAIDDFIRPLGDTVTGRILGFNDDHVRAISAAVGKGRDEIAAGFENAVAPIEEALRETGPLPWVPPLPAGHTLRQVAEFGRFIWTASTRASRPTFSGCLLALVRWPAIREQVNAHHDLIPNFGGRNRSSRSRRASPDSANDQRCGADVSANPAGATVVLCIAAANRDPSRFDQPDVLSLQRSPNPHFGFGKGPHRCPGAGIARAQVAAGLRGGWRCCRRFERSSRLLQPTILAARRCGCSSASWSQVTSPSSSRKRPEVGKS